MIYHYFENKDVLFQRVLERVYGDIRNAERKLELDRQTPLEALETLIRFTWTYYLQHPEFLNLVNSANLHRARHLKASDEIQVRQSRLSQDDQDAARSRRRGGVFRSGVDPVQLTITIAALGFYYLTNRHTLSVIFASRLEDKAVLEARLAFNIDTITRLVSA